MNYSELYFLVNQKGFTIKSLCEQIGMTSTGFKRSIELKTFSWKSIEALCSLLSITPHQLMGWPDEKAESGNYTPLITGGNSQTSNETIRMLREQLKEKDKQISRLMTMLEKFASQQQVSDDYSSLAADAPVEYKKKEK